MTGYRLLSHGQYTESVLYFDEAIRSQPAYADFYLGRGNGYYNLAG